MFQWQLTEHPVAEHYRFRQMPERSDNREWDSVPLRQDALPLSEEGAGGIREGVSFERTDGDPVDSAGRAELRRAVEECDIAVRKLHGRIGTRSIRNGSLRAPGRTLPAGDGGRDDGQRLKGTAAPRRQRFEKAFARCIFFRFPAESVVDAERVDVGGLGQDANENAALETTAEERTGRRAHMVLLSYWGYWGYCDSLGKNLTGLLTPHIT